MTQPHDKEYFVGQGAPNYRFNYKNVKVIVILEFPDNQILGGSEIRVPISVSMKNELIFLFLIKICHLFLTVFPVHQMSACHA